MKKIVLFLILSCLTVSAVERLLDIKLSTGEHLSGRTHNHIFIQWERMPNVSYITQRETKEEIPRKKYWNRRAYVMHMDGIGTIYMFPMELVSKEGKGSCLRGKAVILHDHSWKEVNEPGKLKDIWTSGVWSWRTLGWDEDNGKDPVWGGMMFVLEGE